MVVYTYDANKNKTAETLSGVMQPYGFSTTTYDNEKPIICDGAGNVLTASSVGNPYLFTGRRSDSETGLQFSRARYYSFDLGRFIGRDPIGYGGGMNLYGYCGNMPLLYGDPKGLKHWSWAKHSGNDLRLGPGHKENIPVLNEWFTNGTLDLGG